MKTDYNTKSAEIANSLDVCGIGSDFHNRFCEQSKVIAEFCADIQRRAINQAHYNLTTNVPHGILSRSEATAEHAISSALSGAVAEMVEWGIGPALEISALIAEEVNAHTEASAIRDAIAKAEGRSE